MDKQSETPYDYFGSNGFTRRIVICGSMSFYQEMEKVKQELLSQKIPCIIPENEVYEKNHLSPEQFEIFKRNVSFMYIKKIRNPETFGILVLNNDKHDIPSYVGPNTFAEIAIAFAQSKKIYLYTSIPDMYEDELSAWGAIPLQCSLQPLVKDYKAVVSLSKSQLALF
jgi:hypothetical protein